MGAFIANRWENITDRRTVNGTLVSEFVRRDAHGPIWKCRCSCGDSFFSPHSRIAFALQTSSPVTCGRCVTPAVHSETLPDIRHVEREAVRQAELEKAQRQAQAAKMAAREDAEHAERMRWRTFANHQLNSGVAINSPEWVSYPRWCSWSPEFRGDMLKRIGVTS